MRLTGFILLLFLPVLISGQINIDEETAKKLKNSEEYVTSEFNEEEIAEYIKEKKLKVNMELGTSTFGNPVYEPGFFSPYGYPAANFTRSFVYVEGIYQVNSRLTISGAAYKEFNLFNPPSPIDNRYNFDSKGFIMGVDYRIGDNIFIHGSIEVSDGPGYYRANPFLSPSHGFGSGSFRRMHDPF